MATAETLRRHALELYREAEELEPRNMLVVLRRGNELERLGEWVEAARTYEGAVRSWPTAFEPLYRLAAVQSFATSWRTRPPNRDLAGPSGIVVEALAASVAHWSELVDATRWRKRILVLVRHPIDEGRFYWRDVLPFFGPRVRRRKLCQIALASTQVQRAQHVDHEGLHAVVVDAVGRIEFHQRGVEGRRWQVQYNAACAYARIYGAIGDDPTSTLARTALERSVALAAKAIDGSDGQLSRAWVERDDPDLGAVRSSDEFRASFPGTADTPRRPRTARFHVVPRGRRWALRREGAASVVAVYGTKAEAVEAGRAEARQRRTELIIHRSDGRITDRWRYAAATGRRSGATPRDEPKGE